MRFPDLLAEFYKLQHRVDALVHDVEYIRRQLHDATPPGGTGLRSLVSRETEQLELPLDGDPTEIAGG